MRRLSRRPPPVEAESSCGSCGSDLRLDARFCDRCGAAVELPPPTEEAVAPEPEQRPRYIPDWTPTTPLARFPEAMRFKKTWRPYQARVLSEFDAHVEDRRVHVVAAPGSGKTVLGIEIARVLGSPTLILAPTLAIRDQWIERLTSDFLLDGSAVPGWISTDIRRPEFVTVATYQLLHSVCTGDRSRREAEYADEDGDEAHEDDAAELEETGVQIDVAGLLNRHGFKTVILDECHHLRNEWWKSLTQTVTGISEVTIAALTATPPYDVSPWEWERYIHMCGPVDAEIAVPELVREGNLCCHQDYVYLSLPQEDEANRIGEFRRDVDAFVDDIRADTRFGAALLSHRWVQQPDDYAEQILADPEYLSAIAVYLNGTGTASPEETTACNGRGTEKAARTQCGVARSSPYRTLVR